MRVLLDTRTLLWWVGGDPRLGHVARRIIADNATEVLVSVACLLEIVLKVRAGKLRVDVATLAADIRGQGFRMLGIELAHLTGMVALPTHHRGPFSFDHLLIAQAIAEDATFITPDRHAQRYPVRLLSCTD